MSANNLPASSRLALAVCGWSGSGKTTLLEAVVPELVRDGLAVAVVKHDAHGLDVDTPGKDSDRLFRAGADVVAHSPEEAFARRRGGSELASLLREARAEHDLVLVEGHKGTPLPKVWLASPGDPAPPADVAGVVAVLPWGAGRPARLLEIVRDRLARAWREVPVLGGVLIGGRSRRMGRPKHLLTLAGATFLERVTAALAPVSGGVVLLGGGEVRRGARQAVRLADPPGLEGPMAGILAALRWAPEHAWVIAACDLPRLTAAAVAWLLAQRAPGRWAVIPRGPSGVEPLLAVYEPQARPALERLAERGARAPRLLAEHKRAWLVTPPPELAGCWDNVNTPEELAACEAASGDAGSRSDS